MSAWQTKCSGHPRQFSRFASTARDRSQANTRAPASSSSSVNRPAPQPASSTLRPRSEASGAPRQRSSRVREIGVPVSESSWVRR